MYSFFNKKSAVQQGITIPPEWIYVKDGLRRSLGQVVRYYHNTTMSVKSDHFLARLLQSITVSHEFPLDKYYRHVDAMAMNLSMSMKMTSSIYTGKLFDGIFYGPGNEEILLATDTDFDPRLINREWKSATPVKVLMHPRSDLGFGLPDGKNQGTENGLCVIMINIPMLAVMYRAFRNNEIDIAYQTGDDGAMRTVMNFIHMYVLPNMLFSHIDISVFNRMRNRQMGIPFGESRAKLPFYLTDYTKRLDDVQKTTLKILKTVNYTFSSILRSVPAVVKPNMEEVMLLPDVAPTRQVTWALACARLPVLEFLFRANYESPGNPNRNEVGLVLRDMLRFQTDQIFKSVLPINLYLDVKDEMENIIRYGKQTVPEGVV